MENNCCKSCNTVYKQVAVVLDDGAYMPEYAHFGWDAGADLKSPVDVMIPANGSAVIDTGVHIDIPQGYAGFLKSKSGLNVKHDLTSEGVIDAGYTGSICVKLYNHGKTDFDILPTAKAGGFLHQPPLRSNRGCCVLHDVRQALLPVCPTVRYVLV